MMLATFRQRIASTTGRRLASTTTATRSSSSAASAATTAATAKAATATATAVPTFTSTSTTRSAQDIARLVKLRVDERDSWVGPRQPGFADVASMIYHHFSDLANPPIPTQDELDQVFPVQSIDWELIQNPQNNNNNIQATWLGHSSLLVQMGGCNVLMDPVFAERASPVSFAGPKRYRPTPCTLQELSSKIRIDFVLLSHNHYDHLCFHTVKHLAAADANTQFVVPLGLQTWMQRYVTSKHQIHELDWHESASIHGVNITSVPMKHWSNRVGDRDKTLWCGYVLNHSDSNTKFLFPGDTAWFDGLHDVGETYGPFDMAAIPIGAYEPNDFMRTSHINVQEAVRMKQAVKAKMAVPIHWGTFPLTIEPAMEPREKLVKLMNESEDDDASFAPWLIGETRIS